MEHHEPQDEYLGCLCINAGDVNTIRNVTYRNIRVEHVVFEDVTYTGEGEFASEIKGYDEDRKVVDVRFKNLYVRGRHVLKPQDGNIRIGEFAEGIVFE